MLTCIILCLKAAVLCVIIDANGLGTSVMFQKSFKKWINAENVKRKFSNKKFLIDFAPNFVAILFQVLILGITRLDIWIRFSKSLIQSRRAMKIGMNVTKQQPRKNYGKRFSTIVTSNNLVKNSIWFANNFLASFE